MRAEPPSGQEEVGGRLRASLAAGRLHHAYLFVGASGTGRLAMARWLAAAALCTGRGANPDPCGECQDCRLNAAGRHPDYFETGRPAGRSLLPIETVRDLQDRAALKPVRGCRRVLVVREAERMSAEAANCFLRILEEPPGGCLFILIAASLTPIPETIVSRCQVAKFRSLAPQELCRLLEGEQVAPEEAAWLARRCWGSPGLARLLAEAGLPELNRRLIEELEGLSPADNFRLSEWLNEQAERLGNSRAGAREGLQELLECAALFYRDLAVAAAAPQAEAELCNAQAADRLRKRARTAPAELFLDQAELVLRTMDAVAANANRRLALDDMFTRLALMEKRGTA